MRTFEKDDRVFFLLFQMVLGRVLFVDPDESDVVVETIEPENWYLSGYKVVVNQKKIFKKGQLPPEETVHLLISQLEQWGYVVLRPNEDHEP